MTFRWFGPTDPIPLAHIRQIPGVRGVVSALYDVPVGEPWPRAKLDQLAGETADAGLDLSVIESIPVHEDIKLGRPTRDRLLDQYCESVRNMGEAGVRVLCYNFMPIFDWTRTTLALPHPDGSTALAYDHVDLARVDLSRGTGDLPGWATAHDASTLGGLLAAYRAIDEEALWASLAYFLERVVPVAESANVMLAIHPDDPPWSIFGLPRIVTTVAALERLTHIVDRPANGVTFCTGSLGADPRNDLPAMIRELGSRGRIHFMHCRNIRRMGDKQFRESEHPSRFGDVDMFQVMSAL
ncbi:MAG: mannonate dehydratase, partial [Gemmatimonadaceae bacterium]